MSSAYVKNTMTDTKTQSLDVQPDMKYAPFWPDFPYTLFKQAEAEFAIGTIISENSINRYYYFVAFLSQDIAESVEKFSWYKPVDRIEENFW